MRSFEVLVEEGATADVTGWSFDWLHGRATEQHPPWGYAGLLASRLAGLEVVDLRTARCRMEFSDVGAVVYILRKCVWWVPGFTVGRHRDALLRLDAHIRAEGSFVAHSTRTLIEARRPRQP